MRNLSDNQLMEASESVNQAMETKITSEIDSRRWLVTWEATLLVMVMTILTEEVEATRVAERCEKEVDLLSGKVDRGVRVGASDARDPEGRGSRLGRKMWTMDQEIKAIEGREIESLRLLWGLSDILLEFKANFMNEFLGKN